MNDALEITKLFYNAIGQRSTPAMFKKTMAQAKSLLETYTKEELSQAIEWCAKHPPQNGFYSLGWLSYDINNILNKIKAEEIKKKFNVQQTPIETKEAEGRENKSTRSKSYDFDLFQ